MCRRLFELLNCRIRERVMFILLALGAVFGSSHSAAQTVPEYSLKAAVLYNFALFVEWPESVGEQITVCVIGADPFGAELDALGGEPVGSRRLQVRRLGRLAPLSGCQLLFIPEASMAILPQILSTLDGMSVLTVADSPGAAQAGVGINMGLQNARVVFEINLSAVRRGGLMISSKLLRLAQVLHD
ncbi:YfiR family protein [Nitrogeniibacter aestuarii]|uniref:YfiR family protein n=1 Tax=Nitrogeniibacter aestuarii TaxID=2815343 RepID=UPI001D1024F0|nr:YfiR family protein [Nitrogeniibacter aestuarii]